MPSLLWSSGFRNMESILPTSENEGAKVFVSVATLQWPFSVRPRIWHRDSLGEHQLRGVTQEREKLTRVLSSICSVTPGRSAASWPPTWGIWWWVPNQPCPEAATGLGPDNWEGARWEWDVRSLSGPPPPSQSCFKLSHRSRPVPCHGHLPPCPKPPTCFPSQASSWPHPCGRHWAPCQSFGWASRGWGKGLTPACVMAPGSPIRWNQLPKEKVSHETTENCCSRKRKWFSKMLNLDLRQSNQKVPGLACVFLSSCGQYCSIAVIYPKSQTLALSASSVSPHNDFLYSCGGNNVSSQNYPLIALKILHNKMNSHS